MSLLDNASIVWPLGAQTKAGNLAAWNPQTKSTVPFDVVRATPKQRINEASEWEEVAANVLARDFTSGGCGDFTLEPERKFLFLNSATGVTQNITVVSGRDYAVSFSGTGSITFSVGATGTLTGSGATALDRVSSIVTTTGTSVTCTVSGTVQYVNIEINTNDSSVTYPTSWMKTLGSIVTRNADVPSLTGAGALLGNSEGGLFIEALAFAFDGAFSLGEATLTSTNRLAFRWTAAGNRASLFINVGGVGQVGIDTPVSSVFPNIFYKIALGYATNDVKIYINGVDSGSDTSATMFADDTLTDIRFTTETGALPFYGRIRQFIVFNQRPTDTQLDLVSTP